MCLNELLTFVFYGNLSFQMTIFKLLFIFTSLTRFAEWLAFTDTPLIRTAAESPAKLDIWHNSEKLPILRTYGYLPLSRQPNFIALTLVNGHQSAFFDILAALSQIIISVFLPLLLLVSVNLVTEWTFRFPFSMILLWNYRTYLHTTVMVYLICVDYKFFIDCCEWKGDASLFCYYFPCL